MADQETPVRKRVQTHFTGESRTKQSHRDQCNINTIMTRARRTGFLPGQVAGMSFGDFTSGMDFHEAQSRVAAAKSDFESLPSSIRNRFENDPAKLIAFMENESNRDEAVELGLVEKPEEVPIEPKPAPPAEE